MINEDINYVKDILPKHYIVEESKKKGSVHCISEIGIEMRKGTDHEDEEHFEYIFQAIKNHFGIRFQEIFHNVCFLHKDFTIYLKPLI